MSNTIEKLNFEFSFSGYQPGFLQDTDFEGEITVITQDVSEEKINIEVETSLIAQLLNTFGDAADEYNYLSRNSVRSDELAIPHPFTVTNPIMIPMIPVIFAESIYYDRDHTIKKLTPGQNGWKGVFVYGEKIQKMMVERPILMIYNGSISQFMMEFNNEVIEQLGAAASVLNEWDNLLSLIEITTEHDEDGSIDVQLTKDIWEIFISQHSSLNEDYWEHLKLGKLLVNIKTIRESILKIKQLQNDENFQVRLLGMFLNKLFLDLIINQSDISIEEIKEKMKLLEIGF
jgi:hypothetical protein